MLVLVVLIDVILLWCRNKPVLARSIGVGGLETPVSPAGVLLSAIAIPQVAWPYGKLNVSIVVAAARAGKHATMKLFNDALIESLNQQVIAGKPIQQRILFGQRHNGADPECFTTLSCC